MKKILVIGSINIDLVTNVKKTPRVGETVFGEAFLEFPGGKGANQAAAIGKLGGDVTMLGCVGTDAHGQFMIDSLKASNVKVDWVNKSSLNHTGTALIMVNDNGDNSIVVIPGSNFEVLPDRITKELIQDFDMVIGQLEVPEETLSKAFKIAKKLGIMTLLNPAPAKKLSSELLKNVSLLVPNETELEVLTGIKVKTHDDILKAYGQLRRYGTEELIVTLGSQGSALVTQDGIRTFKAQKVKALDTTAAGDSFIGGLVTQMAMDKSIEEAIEYATKVAAITITRMGAQSSLPNKEEVI